MLSTPMYNGQGLGNQLHCYVTTRCIALDKGYEFGIQFPERFKGTFMNLDMGVPVLNGITTVEGGVPEKLPDGITSYYREQGNGEYDQSIFDLPDNTLVHGNLQGEEYFKHRKDEIKEWLKVEPLDLPDDICVINVRGGEYKYVPDFILPKAYWDNAVIHMKSINPDMKFQVHTDDREYAQSLFPEYEVIADMALNWRSIRYAKYVILSNSSFGWLPAWLGDNYVVAPIYWGRHNKRYWFLEQNKTEKFHYVDSI